MLGKNNISDITAAFFGDGASNQGTFHESINLASVWKLPVIFICENNGFAISVPAWQSTSVKNISARAAGYNIPGITIDGNDVLAVCEAADNAIKRARSGGGPSLIECVTYRWKGHWTGDPEVYRTRAEVEEWMKKCPIKRLRKYMAENGLISESELDKIEEEAQSEVNEAVEFALNSPEPDPERVLEDVFA
jgi:pyruvate dehydrogenase E1 component alpha subunit